jgi:hypothetical protein
MSRKELTKDKEMAWKMIWGRMLKSGVIGNVKLE